MRRRWKLSVLFALSISLAYPLDCVILGHSSPATLVMRGVESLEILLYMSLWQWLGPRWEHWLDGVHGMMISAFFMGLVFFTGGSQSPYLSLAPSLPLMTALLFTETALPTLLSGLVCMVGTLGAWLAQGRVVDAMAWSSLVGASSFLGLYGAMRFRAAQAAGAEVRVERTRRESLEKLAMAERQRAQSEKLATVGRLAANVMHELNNPLAFVRANLDFLRTEMLTQSLPDAMRAELSQVFSETHLGLERMRQIVADLRGFSRMEGEDLGQCSLADVVTDAAMLAEVRLKNVARLKVEMAPQLPEVYASSRRLAQVLLNLLVNAGDALEGAQVQDGEVRVKGWEQHGRVLLDVEDNGPGFTPEALTRLFESFFTTKGPEKGTGLGLSLSREMMERFGGTLHAENRPEGGARLRMSLPVHPAA